MSWKSPPGCSPASDQLFQPNGANVVRRGTRRRSSGHAGPS
jgi:hypothetical protein